MYCSSVRTTSRRSNASWFSRTSQAGDQSGVDFEARQDVATAEGEVELRFAAVERHCLDVVRPCRQLRLLVGA